MFVVESGGGVGGFVYCGVGCYYFGGVECDVCG